MEKKEMLYEGKAKKVYATEDPDVLIVSYKDDATAFNGLKKGTIVGKGAINNRMTNFIFKKLEEKGVPTHLVEELNDRETAVRKVEIVPLEVIVRNYSAGSFAKKMGMEEGIRFKCPTLEFSYKNDDLGDPFINSYYALALGLATGVIASVMNQMGSMLGDSILGWIVFILVFVIGHTFNLLINLLGAYVHTCRLQYVEFFGKFFEGGGKEFHPFRENTKYVDIKED